MLSLARAALTMNISAHDLQATLAEQDDGKGYPRGVVPTVQAAQLLRIVDVYMAKITGCAGAAAVGRGRRRQPLRQERPGADGGHAEQQTWQARGRNPVSRQRRAAPEFTINGPLMDVRNFSRVLPERVFGMMLA